MNSNVLLKLFPNPFNSTTTITYALPASSASSAVNLTLYDLSGREIKVLVEGKKQAGVHRTVLNAADMPSGLYFVRMQAGEFVAARKVMLIR